MKKYFNKILFLVVGLLLAATASYLNAWSGPPTGTTPPDNNVVAPVNLSASNQIKLGGLSVASLLSTGAVAASQYCDINGANCSTPPFGGGSVPAGTVAAFNLTTCPAGWLPSDGTNGTTDLRGVFVRGMESFDNGATISTRDPDRPNGTIGYTSFNTNPVTYVNTLGTFQGSEFIAHGHANPSAGINGGNESRPENVALLFCQKDGTSSDGGSNTGQGDLCGSASYQTDINGNWPSNAQTSATCRGYPIVVISNSQITYSCPSGYTAARTAYSWDSGGAAGAGYRYYSYSCAKN